jgi:thermitase
MRLRLLSRRHPAAALLSLAAGLSVILFVTASGSAAVGQSRLLVKFRPGTAAGEHAAAIGAVGGTVEQAIPDIGVKVVSVPSTAAAGALAHLKAAPNVEFAESDATAEAADVPDDPSFSLQWGMNKIKAPDAWTTNHGDPSVNVAVLDTGVSLTHPDLQGKVLASTNFSSSSTVDDVNGHGSHVAGIAAATTNNAVGVAGVGYNADIMNVKVLGDSGSGLYSDVCSGITWAADHGADVINLSLGGTMASSALESAVNYAWSKGVVVVAAAGNNASSTPFYPAYYANVIAVAATTDLDRLASFSDFGDWVDVSAPGISVYSTIPGGYGYMSGTSMASPFVSGLAALLFAQLSDTNGNGLLNDEVRSRIQSTADNVGLTGIGSGRINAYRAVTDASPPSPPANRSAPTISGSATVGQTLEVTTGTWTNSPTSYAYQWQRCDGTGAGCSPISGATLSAYTPASTDVGSTIRVQVTATNTAGSASTSSTQTAVVVVGAPANTALPAISGTAQDGQTLLVSTGTWTNSPSSYAYQWLRCDSLGSACAAVAGATAAVYTLGAADVGSTMGVAVTATNAGGSAGAQSALTGAVAAIAPANTSPPAESGSAKPGQTLTSSAGSWTGTAPLGFAYQWLRCDSTGAGCAAIAAATSSSYTVSSADLGSTIRSRVTASNAGGQAWAQSAPTAPVSSVQTLTFTGTVSKSSPSFSFPVALGAGQADASLAFAKSATMSVKLVDSNGNVLGQSSGPASPVKLTVAGLAAGTYRYVVGGTGFKGSVGFTLKVTAPAP